MQISDDALNEFMTIYREEFGEEIDRTEATEMAHRLVALYTLLAKKLPNETTAATPKSAKINDLLGRSDSTLNFG
jgi:hypothetical protein